MFMLEDAIAAEVQRDRLLSYQFVRAKAYELFLYHYKYESSDYTDIKAFLQQSYNLGAYRGTNRQWDNFKGADWSKSDKFTARILKDLMRKIKTTR